MENMEQQETSGESLPVDINVGPTLYSTLPHSAHSAQELTEPENFPATTVSQLPPPTAQPPQAYPPQTARRAAPLPQQPIPQQQQQQVVLSNVHKRSCDL